MDLIIACVDPLPHQLEAIYDYFMRLPRIRFLLADDPGAGKTIMAGLLIKELKIRGLIKLRRIKEALVTFPDPETGDVRQLFTRRKVQTASFHLNLEEMDFYDELTRYVEDQSIKASEDDSARGRALGFTMAMLQRRFASSVFAVRRSLERMKATREKILADPDAYRQEQILKRIPEDFEDLPDDEQQEIMLRLEEVVPSIDPASLRDKIARLAKLIDAAHVLEAREIETKLTKLQDVITEQGVFSDPKMKLLSMVREMYARNQTEAAIKERIVKEVDTEGFRFITHATLEGLAKRELNLSAILGRSAAAKERRLVPEVIEDFLLQASPIAGLDTKAVRKDGHTYRVGKVPHTLVTHLYPKRLIEVDLPIKRISAHARREKSIRHGHISTLHIWWAGAR